MLDLSLIRTRLADECASLNRVRIVADFDGVLGLQACNPSEAFVGGLNESPDENFALGAVSQRINVEFSVWIAVRRTVDATLGEVWQSNLLTPRQEVITALQDYEVSSDFSGLQQVSVGEVQQVSRHLAYWRMVWGCWYVECNVI